MSGYGVKRSEGKSNPIIITKDNAIARGRYIKNIEYRKTDKAEFLTIEVRDKDGNTARKSYFPPKLGSGFVQTKELLEKEERKLNGVMTNLTEVLISKKYETGPVSSFEEFCKKIIADVGKAYYDKELRIKLIYDSKNRPTLPAFPLIFEDPSLVSDENTRLKISDRDRVEPVVVKMDEDIPPVATTPIEENDLPF